MKTKQFDKFLRNTKKFIDGKLDKAPTLSLGPKRALKRFSYLSMEDSFAVLANALWVWSNASQELEPKLVELRGFFTRVYEFLKHYHGHALFNTLLILSQYNGVSNPKNLSLEERYEQHGRDALLNLHHSLTMISPHDKEELELVRKWAHSSPFLKSFATIEDFRKSAVNYLVEIDHRLGIESGGKTVLYYERILQPVLSDATLEALS